MIGLLTMLAACDDSPAPPVGQAPPTEVEPPTLPAVVTPSLPPEPEPEATPTDLLLSTRGNHMALTKAALSAPAGPVRLTFTNRATEPTMLHNMLIIRADHTDEIGLAGIDAGPDRDYVPAHDAVLAASPLLSPEESAELLVTLDAGTYHYLCTFPGHYLTEKGTLQISAP